MNLFQLHEKSQDMQLQQEVFKHEKQLGLTERNLLNARIADMQLNIDALEREKQQIEREMGGPGREDTNLRFDNQSVSTIRRSRDSSGNRSTNHSDDVSVQARTHTSVPFPTSTMSQVTSSGSYAVSSCTGSYVTAQSCGSTRSSCVSSSKNNGSVCTSVTVRFKRTQSVANGMDRMGVDKNEDKADNDGRVLKGRRRSRSVVVRSSVEMGRADANVGFEQFALFTLGFFRSLPLFAVRFSWFFFTSE